MKKILTTIFAAMLIVSALPLFAGGAGEKAAGGKKMYRVGVIPKFIAEDYFIACERGFRQAEKELGNVKVDWIGDTMSQTSAAHQKNYIQGFIDKGYDAILISALDPHSYADTLRAAMAKGIKVISWDADVEPTARNFFVNQAESDQIAIQLLKGLAGSLEGYSASNKAKIALVSTTNDSPNQNAWLKAIIDEYNSKKDGEYKAVDLMGAPDQIVYAGNDRGTADVQIKSLLTAHPDIKGIIALSSNTVPAVSSSRDQLGITSQIKILGVSVPESSRGDMVAGKMSGVVLWQPFDLGYLALHVAVDVLEGKAPSGSSYVSPLSGTLQTASFKDGKTSILYPASGHKILADNVIILGDPIVWNLKNIDYFRGYPDASHGMSHFLQK